MYCSLRNELSLCFGFSIRPLDGCCCAKDAAAAAVNDNEDDGSGVCGSFVRRTTISEFCLT